MVTPNPAAAAPLSPADDFAGFTDPTEADAVLPTVPSPGNVVLVLSNAAGRDGTPVGGDAGITVPPSVSLSLLLWYTPAEDGASGAEETGKFVLGVPEIASEEERGGRVLDTTGAGAMEITMGVMPPVFVDGDAMVAV
ncbi:hypothetical protein BM1_05141 [Bipolaris maydis]|nr:hypothetical protein BM1_05141 [Bipolaris maydis]